MAKAIESLCQSHSFWFFIVTISKEKFHNLYYVLTCANPIEF